MTPKPQQEIIVNIGQITRDLLRNFFARNRVKPSRIVMYRDGVGETQFEDVFQREVMAIKSACERLDAGYSPKVHVNS
jgi:eukaryotic translation initiation factor 2C